MVKKKIFKFGAAILTLVLLGSAFIVPNSAQTTTSSDNSYPMDVLEFIEQSREHPEIPISGDTDFTPESELGITTTTSTEWCDIGYNADAGDRVLKYLTVYVGEPIDEHKPGRGRTGSLDATNRDTGDWFGFTACKGQKISASVTGGFDLQLADVSGNVIENGYTVPETGRYFINIYTTDGVGTYTFSVTLSGQNDADSGSDAGNDMGSATPIIPGSYSGYMSNTDVEDWYSFQVNSGEGIFVTVDPLERSDYDIHLYNPNGELVQSALFYGTDELEHPADMSGNWKIKLDIFPGWDTSKWPDNYDLYGSGAYDLDLSVGGTATDYTVGPVPQRKIIPVAQTFVVTDDPNSNKDEYGYIAAVPAATYIDNNQQYVSPIVYQGVDTITNWFGTIDDTTQYLLDDWQTYLARHALVADEFIIPSDPITAAKEIAIANWDSSDTAIVVCDGSTFEDEIVSVFDETVTLSSSPEITRVQPGDFQTFGSELAKIMYINGNYGAIHLWAKGESYAGGTALITPRYERVQDDTWPHPDDSPGPCMDTWYPITTPGIWIPIIYNENNLDEFEIIKYPGDRYTIPIDEADASIEVAIETDEPSLLRVFLIDPEGNIRRPMVPEWNGGEIEPIHVWNGGHWEHNWDEYRRTILEPATEREVSVHNAMAGDWTVIVVPYIDQTTGYGEFSGTYHITANVRSYGSDRVNAEMSAANGAVLASMNHAPLLYVTKDTVPTDTSNTLSALGVSKIIFVNIGDVSSASLSGSVTEYTTMEQVVEAIKADSHSENFITITSSGTGDGFFAPSAMIAAYHGSPVLNIAEAKSAYNSLDVATTWREWAGDAYHGCRTMGHLPQMDHPSELPTPPTWLQIIIYYLTHDKELPHPGLDLELTLMTSIHDGIYNMIDSYGLDRAGQEVYMFVAPRDTDIRDLAVRAFLGNNSYAGHIQFDTPAMDTALISRDVLYPAIIYANPGRDVTTTQMMNFPDGWSWTTNNGKANTVFSTRDVKESFFAHGRFYEGHCQWEGSLERYNTGASVSYYSGHGTGGSGISAQYKIVNEAFPLVELEHEYMKDYEFPDAWRGYMYDDTQTKDARWGGFTWYNAAEPNLYDIIHFKWVDQLFENLHSLIDVWMSCTTASNFGPEIYLEHGTAVYFGNGNTGLCPQEDLLDDMWLRDMMVNGTSVGQAFSKYLWLHQRDYTTMDPTTIYGSSSLQVSNEQMIFGDPTIIPYSPEWTEPIPVVS